MFHQQLSDVVIATDEDDGPVENHQRVEIAVNLAEFPVRLDGGGGMEQSHIADDGVTFWAVGQSPGASCQSPDQTEQHYHYCDCHPHSANAELFGEERAVDPIYNEQRTASPKRQKTR